MVERQSCKDLYTRSKLSIFLVPTSWFHFNSQAGSGNCSYAACPENSFRNTEDGWAVAGHCRQIWCCQSIGCRTAPNDFPRILLAVRPTQQRVLAVALARPCYKMLRRVLYIWIYVNLIRSKWAIGMPLGHLSPRHIETLSRRIQSGHQSDPHFASLYHMPPLQMVMQRKTVSWLQVFTLQDKEYIETQE